MQKTELIYIIIAVAVIALSILWVHAIDNEPKGYNGKDLFGNEI